MKSDVQGKQVAVMDGAGQVSMGDANDPDIDYPGFRPDSYMIHCTQSGPIDNKNPVN